MEKLLSILAVLLALVAIGVAIFAVNSQNEVVIPSAEEIASKVNVSVVQEVVNNSKLDELYNDYFEDEKEEELKNETAKALVMAELSSRDFIKEVKALLENNSISNMSIDSYKDLEIYMVKIESSEVSGDDAEVVIEFKVKGFEDDDEDSDFKARLNATFIVSDLDIDELEDAEADLDSLNLEKFYD